MEYVMSVENILRNKRLSNGSALGGDFQTR